MEEQTFQKTLISDLILLNIHDVRNVLKNAKNIQKMELLLFIKTHTSSRNFKTFFYIPLQGKKIIEN